ncbi:MAG: hypothetical protein ACKVSF_09685 [Alphaproteobacteria bacterium]
MGEIGGGRGNAVLNLGTGFMVLAVVVAAFSQAAVALLFRIGVAPSLERMVLAVHAAGVLAAFGLSLTASVRAERILPWLSHPVILGVFSLAAWSALLAPFVEAPWSSVLGAEFGGQGALQYLDIAILVLAVCVLSSDPRVSRVAPAIGLASSLVLPVAIRFGVDDEIIFREYLAPFALTGPVFAYLLLAPVKPRWSPLAMLAAVPALVAATNVTAWVVVLGIGFPSAVAAWAMVARRRMDERTVRRVAACLVPVLMVGTVIAVVVLGSFDLWRSLTSRVYLLKVIWAAIAEKPSIWAIGQGWGGTSDSIIAHFNSSGAVMWDGSWDATLRGFTHSHNFGAELLLSAGLPGLALGVFIVSSIVLSARQDAVPAAVGFALASTAYLSMWFFVIGNWAIFALALGALLAAPRPQPDRKWAFSRGLPVIALAVQSVAFGWLVHAALDARSALGDGPPTACACLEGDRVHKGAALAHAARIHARALFADIRAGRPIGEERIGRLRSLLCGLDREVEIGLAPGPLISAINIRASLALDPLLANLRQAMPGVLDAWAAQTRRSIELAPRRSDIAIAYLEWEMSQGNWRTVLGAAHWILSRAPDDPVGLWYAGLALMSSQNPNIFNESRAIGRRALANGIERFMKVEPEIKQFFMQY